MLSCVRVRPILGCPIADSIPDDSPGRKGYLALNFFACRGKPKEITAMMDTFASNRVMMSA